MSSIYDEPPITPQPYQPPKPHPGAPFDPQAYGPTVAQGPPVEPKKKSGCTCVGCLLGCFGLVVVLTILGGVGAWWGVKKIPDWTRNVIDKAVQGSDLTPEDKQVVMTQVDRLVVGYKQGKVDLQKLAQFGEKLAKSPLMDLMIAYAAKVKYIEPSDLSDEEKAEAEKVLQRLARGVVEEKIPDDELDVALNHISSEVGNGGRQFRENVSDAELRAFIKECKKLADDAEIPEGEYHVDIGGELKKLVDEILGEVSEVEKPDAQPQLPAELPADPSAEKPAEKPGEPTAEKPAEPSAEKPAEKTEEKIEEQPAEKPENNSAVKAVEA